MSSPNPQPQDVQKKTEPPSPFFLGAALLFAVIACSSASVVFSVLTLHYGVPAALAASWRLWCQEFLLLVPFLVDFRNARRRDSAGDFALEWIRSESLSEDESESEVESSRPIFPESAHEVDETSGFIPRYISALPWMILSGFFLGVHFSSWVYSIKHTSLVHSLLWVTMGPIIINWGQWVAYFLCVWFGFKFFESTKRPSNMETFGATVGLIGAIITLFDVAASSSSQTAISSTSSNLNQPPTLKGDLAAFVGACAVSIYLIIGQKLRKWVPLFLYAFPVVGSSIVTCVLFSLVLEDGVAWRGVSAFSVFGFLNKKYILLAFYLGAVPGVCGHTILNALLKYMSPLTISTALLSEPILGSLLGYLLGMQSIPGPCTWAGGFVLLLGLFLVISGEHGSGEHRKEKSGVPQEDTICRTADKKEILIESVSYGSIHTT